MSLASSSDSQCARGRVIVIAGSGGITSVQRKRHHVHAIFHGIEPGMEPGTVLIRITHDKDQVRVLLANPYHPEHHRRAGNRMALANGTPAPEKNSVASQTDSATPASTSDVSIN